MQLMTHIVVGFPNLQASEKLVAVLANAGSDIIELQIPFSDPVADGPTIAAANEVARRQGVTAKECLAFARKMTRKFPAAQFYFMSYYNPIFSFGIQKFVIAAKQAGVKGLIIPDLPVEEADELIVAAKKDGLEIIFVLAPNTADERIKKITKVARGFLYCVARLGVTGKATSFDAELKKFLNRVKKFTKLPLAVGFGVSERKDVLAIQKAGGQIAVVGSALMQTYEKRGLQAIQKFVRGLRAAG